MQLIAMNYHIFSRADYLKKKKAVHQSPEEEEEEAKEADAQKNHCAKEGCRGKERPASVEKLGPKNKTTHKLISKTRTILINIERRLNTRYNF